MMYQGAIVATMDWLYPLSGFVVGAIVGLTGIPSCSLFKGRISCPAGYGAEPQARETDLAGPARLATRTLYEGILITGTKSASSRNSILGRKAGAALTGTLNA
jgi:hypothetical protein